MLEYRAKTDDSGDTCSKCNWGCDNPGCPIHPMPDTLTTYSWNRTGVNAIDASNTLRMSVCNFGNSVKKPLNISVDMVRWHLYLKPATFTDVPIDNWAWADIEALVKAGIAQGNGDGTYTPLATVTRGQMAVFLARALCGGDTKVPTAPATADFTDVPTTHWAFKYVECVYSKNIAAGNGDGTYSPDGIVDRGQMSVFISRSIVTPTGEAGLASYTPPTTPTFPDVPTSLWTFKYVEYLHENHIVNGEGDGLYHPEYDVTRDQMAVFITRAFGLTP